MLFLALAVLCAGCIVAACFVRRKNYGYIFSAALIVAADIICFLLMGTMKVMDAKKYIMAFDICHIWMFFGAMWTISFMSKKKAVRLFMIPAGVISVLQTVQVCGEFFDKRIMMFTRHIFLGKTWWVSQGLKSLNGFFSFSWYITFFEVSAVIILIATIVGRMFSTKVFRSKFYATLVMQFIILVIEVVSLNKVWPIWVITIVLNIVCVISLYFVNFYSVTCLRRWSLVSFADEMSDGYALYDEYNDPIYMNRILKNIFSEELIQEFTEKEYLEDWISHTERVGELEVIRYENGDETYYFDVKKKELEQRGINLGSIYIFHDATMEIRRTRVMEESNEELLRASKMKSDFLANMSHEIRTPMNAVIGMAEIALREDLNEQARGCLEQIQKSGRNLLDIINDILDYSKIEAGKLDICPEEYDPIAELTDVANVVQTRIGEKKLEIFVTADTNLPKKMYGDALRLRQIIVNLAGNAVKFTKHGTVVIRVLCWNSGEDTVTLTVHVEDTGCGIKEEDLSKLFESFQQVDSKRNRSAEGTGLGLAICKSLVDAMGGTIGVKSEYGKGSDFYFSLPQKVVDAKSELEVKDAANKFAYYYNPAHFEEKLFVEDLDKLQIKSRIIRDLDEYRETGKKNYLFFEESMYGSTVSDFLDLHPRVTGIMIAAFDSTYESDKKNLKVMRCPVTIWNDVRVLNEEDEAFAPVGAEKKTTPVKKDGIAFTAPDAHILIVDDNEINITVARGLLKPLLVKCSAATSGKDAIHMMEKHRFDLVLMDHMMPEMDGIEATAIIQQTIPSAANTPIIAFTANVLEGAKDMFLAAGMKDMISKPVSVKTLSDILLKWLPAEMIIKAEDTDDGNGESTADSEVAEKAPLFECLDNETAIENLGSENLFVQIVKEYVRQGEDKIAKIREFYEAEDWHAYAIEVHALKSSSRQIGYYPLGDMAEAMEKAGKADDEVAVRRGTEVMLDEYRSLLGKLAPYFEEKQEGDLPLLTPEELKGELNRMLEACDNLDMDTMEEVTEVLRVHGYADDATKDRIMQLCNAADEMNVDICEEIINDLM